MQITALELGLSLNKHINAIGNSYTIVIDRHCASSVFYM